MLSWGKLKLYRQFKLTSDNWVLSTLKGASIELTGVPLQSGPPPPMKYSAMEADIIQQEIAALLRKRVIVPTEKEDEDFFSNIFS